MKLICLGSGSKGNCVLIIEKNTKILVDFGLKYTEICEKLESLNYSLEEIDYVLISHTHSDHIKGLNAKKIPRLNLYLLRSMTNEIDCSKFNIFFYKRVNVLKDIKVLAFKTSHDVDSVGFIIQGEEKEIVYVTDTGYLNNRLLPYLKNKDLYFLESNHDVEMLINGPYPPFLKQRILSDKGHLSNDLSAQYLKKIIGEKTKCIVLSHLSEKNNTKEKALNTLKRELETCEHNVDKIIVASQEEVSELIEV